MNVELHGFSPEKVAATQMDLLNDLNKGKDPQYHYQNVVTIVNDIPVSGNGGVRPFVRVFDDQYIEVQDLSELFKPYLDPGTRVEIVRLACKFNVSI